MIDWSRMQTAEDRAAQEVDDARAAATMQLMADLADLGRYLTGDVPEAEKLSWNQKEAAAIAYLDDPATTIPAITLLQAEAAATGEDVADLAQVIVAKAVAYRAASGSISGIRRKYQGLIASAASVADVPGPDDWGAELAALTQ